MKFLAGILFFMLLSNHVLAQSGEYSINIFKDVDFRSQNGTYKASLEKNIFQDLVYTDNKNNSITFSKKYLDKNMPGIQDNPERKQAFMQELVRSYIRESKYVATYEIDIFNAEIFKDNRGNHSENGKDIFGNVYVSETNGVEKSSIHRDINGKLAYSDAQITATLGKDIFGVWVYQDSQGNQIQFNSNSWEKMIKRYGDDQQILWHLIDEFVYDRYHYDR